MEKAHQVTKILLDMQIHEKNSWGICHLGTKTPHEHLFVLPMIVLQFTISHLPVKSQLFKNYALVYLVQGIK